MLTVLHSWHDLSFRGSVTLQLVGDDDARNKLQALHQLTEELLRGLLVPFDFAPGCRAHGYLGQLLATGTGPCR